MIIRPIINTLIINSYNSIILIKEILILLEIKKLMVTPFAILIKGARKCQKPLIMLKVLLKNIIRTLRLEIKKILIKIRKLLPAQYYDYLPFFEGGIAAELPPYYLGINYTFTLEQSENG